jgi:hypothetical protein
LAFEEISLEDFYGKPDTVVSLEACDESSARADDCHSDIGARTQLAVTIARTPTPVRQIEEDSWISI